MIGSEPTESTNVQGIKMLLWQGESGFPEMTWTEGNGSYFIMHTRKIHHFSKSKNAESIR